MNTFLFLLVVVSHMAALSQDQCIYKGYGYQQGQKWQDGCDYDCECLNSTSGHYRCTERCVHYNNLPSYCPLEPTDDPCCFRPVCPFLGPGNTTCASDDGWVPYQNQCYFIFDGGYVHSKTWRESRNYCRSKGGDLVSINSVQEQRFIQTQIPNTSAVNLWIGLSEVDLDVSYKWSDGVPVTYLNWQLGEPNDLSGPEDCVEMKVSNGKWNDVHCSMRRGFVCEKRPGGVATNLAPPMILGNCPPGYTADQHDNMCYRIFTTPMSWYNASKFCRTQGVEKYYLASINSDLDNAFLTTLLRGLNINPWIGLRRHARRGLFWSDNNDITYVNWHDGEPSVSFGMEICGRIYGSRNNAGKWDDLDCETKLPFICETKRKSYIPSPKPIPNPCKSKKGYKPFGNACFKFMENPLPWSVAQVYCETHGAFLVTITTEFEQAFLRLLVNYKEIWTGLNDIKSSGMYTWINEAWPVTYTAWDAGEPRVQNGACVSMNSTNGRWRSTSCNRNLAFVCKITADNPPATSPTSNGQCSGRGWILNGSKCLLFRPKDYKTYLDATLECHREQASLVSIHSVTENQFLMQTFHAKYSVEDKGLWIGLHRSSSTSFSWSDYSSMNFFNWNQQPVSRDQLGNDEKCVEIDFRNGKWNYLDCALKRGYICQKSPVLDVNAQTLPSYSNSTLASMSNTPERHSLLSQASTHRTDTDTSTTNAVERHITPPQTSTHRTDTNIPTTNITERHFPPPQTSTRRTNTDTSTTNAAERHFPPPQTSTRRTNTDIPTNNAPEQHSPTPPLSSIRTTDTDTSTNSGNTKTLSTTPTTVHNTESSTPGLDALKSRDGPRELNGESEGGSKSLSGGSIAGIVVAVIIAVVLVITALVLFKWSRRRRDETMTLSFDNTAYRYDTKPENGESVS